jgi:antagonist of KipI
MTLIGGRYRLQRAATLALTGAALPAKLDGTPIERWSALDVPEGSLLEIGSAESGARVYLCVAGGIETPLFLSSASTHLMTGLGGWRGRALRKGDVLIIGSARNRPPGRRIRREMLARLAPRKLLRVTPAPQSAWFTDEQRAAFVSDPYRVTQEANRMGLRLEGTPVPCAESSHMITEGVALGAIQIPANGQPIVLFVEQQTTGGYPKIANVISADLPSVGQLRPGDEVRFEWVSVETARALLRDQARLLTPEELFV